MKNIYGLLLVVFYFSTAHAQGNALAFDGTNDYVNLSSSINLSGSSFTLEAWFNATTNIASSSTKRFIISVGATSGGSNQQVNILLNGDGVSQAYIKTGFYGSDLVYNWSYDANWHHVAFSYDAATNQGILYLDGANVASQVFSSDLIGSGRATIGTPAWNIGNETFYGNIDEVRIWNTVRTASEISNNMNNNSLSPSTTGLVAYYHFDQGTAGGDNTGVTTLTDATANSYNGTLNNFALTGTLSNWIGENNAALPVELVSFNAINLENKIALRWQTATEVNNYGFEVEKLKVKSQTSNSELKWTNVGFVKGNGNSSSAKEYSFIDDKISAGKHLYRLKQIDNDGKFEYSKEVEVDFGTPNELSLNQNYPNPFNPQTTISYELPVSGKVLLKVYDVLGKEIVTLVNEEKSAGTYSVKFNGKDLSSGFYSYRIQAGDLVQTKKMILMK